MLAGMVLAVAVGCNPANLAQNTQPAAQIQVAVSPRTVGLAPKAQQRFTASVQGTANSAVTWLASAGSIASDGTFTAPATKTPTSITITATSVADPTQNATSTVTIQVAAARLALATSFLSSAVVNTGFSTTFSASGGTPPYQWTISAGSTVPGLQLQSASGVYAGVPSQQGSYSFTVQVTDAASNSTTHLFTLAVAPPSNAKFDGPAELPRVYLSTALADTPAPGVKTDVVAGGDLKGAIDNANCGDTIQLQAGANFVVQDITLPAKSCDDQRWIIIRTSTPDSSLPAEGTRMTPCYAGVSSLPGRPVFSCSHPQHLLATITYSGTGDGPIIFANGANHYRLIGLEITRSANNGKSVGGLVVPTTLGSMDQIVLDRLYIHGTPGDETRRAVRFSGATNASVQDSYISEIHCKQNGTCTDSQAVSAGSGSLATGPLRIVDNFLEASGENILFGGSAATQTPADVEIRFNHLFKPMFWLQGQPGYVSPSFVVKNHFELKNAQRVLFDSNVLEDNWGGSTQHGYSVVLTPKNEFLNNQNLCPLCQVTDITVRYVTISHVAGGFEISNGLDAATAGPPLQGQRYSIHDVIVDDIDAVKYGGYGDFAQVSTIASPLLQNVAINHVTAFPSHSLFNVGGPNNLKMPGFVFANSIVTSGQYPIWSTGQFQNADCAYLDVPLTTVEDCFSGYSFSPNALLSVPAQYPSSKWPSGNTFYNSPADIGFVNYNNGSGGDYHLLSTSPAKGAASDGTDLGASVDAVLAAISNVQ